MYPDLSYVFHDLFGTQVDNWTSIFKTFGVFLALAFVASYWVVKSEFKRKENEGVFSRIKVKHASGSRAIQDALINGLFGFILGFKIPAIIKDFESFKADPSGMIFSGQGNYAIGFIVAALLGTYYFINAKNSVPVAGEEDPYISPHDKVGDIILVSAIFGVIGARLASVFENMDAFWQDPIGQLFSGSGLTVYGGVILAFIVVYYYVKKLGIKPIHVMDTAGLAILAGYGIGRMGCQFAGDGDWGIVNTQAKPSWFVFPDWMWSFDYPRNVLNEGIRMADCTGHYCSKLSQGVYPTPVYEIVATGLIFLFLWSIRKKVKTPGVLFFMFLVFNGLERFFVEFIRVNPRYDILGMEWSLSQFIAFAFIIIGIIGILKLKSGSSRKPDYTIPDLGNGSG